MSRARHARLIIKSYRPRAIMAHTPSAQASMPGQGSVRLESLQHAAQSGGKGIIIIGGSEHGLFAAVLRVAGGQVAIGVVDVALPPAATVFCEPRAALARTHRTRVLKRFSRCQQRAASSSLASSWYLTLSSACSSSSVACRLSPLRKCSAMLLATTVSREIRPSVRPLQTAIACEGGVSAALNSAAA